MFTFKNAHEVMWLNNRQCPPRKNAHDVMWCNIEKNEGHFLWRNFITFSICNLKHNNNMINIIGHIIKQLLILTFDLVDIRIYQHQKHNIYLDRTHQKSNKPCNFFKCQLDNILYCNDWIRFMEASYGAWLKNVLPIHTLDLCFGILVSRYRCLLGHQSTYAKVFSSVGCGVRHSIKATICFCIIYH